MIPRRAACLGMLPAAMLLPAALAGCTGDDPPPRQDFPALHFDFLTPLRLNIGTVDLADPPPPGPLDALNPAPPAQALLRMAQDRIGAGGTTGRAVFTIDAAGINEARGGLSGVMAVHLDIIAPDGARLAFAEARVSRSAQRPRRADLRGVLYDMTRAMMDDMNVEFEFQARRALRDWLQTPAVAPAPAPVQKQDLTAPGTPPPPPDPEL